MNLLALGWHASPTFNEDNHGYNWTIATNSTTYVLAPALTRENILDAFRRRRTYSTSDSTMKVWFEVNGEVMGARLRDPEKLAVEVIVTTESEAGIGNIALVAEDNIVVASVNAGALRKYRWKLTLPPLYDYYYVRITGKGRYTVTAPVWIEGNQPLRIKSSPGTSGTTITSQMLSPQRFRTRGRLKLRIFGWTFTLCRPVDLILKPLRPMRR